MGTLKARVSGAWVPVLGSGFDAANTARWNSAWGVVGTAVVTANQGGIVGTTVAVTGAVVTVTTVAGRRYIISFEALPSADVADTTAQFNLLRDGSQINSGVVTMRTANIGSTSFQKFVDAPAAGSHTYTVNAVRAAGTGTITLGANATIPMVLTVEDAGPTVPASIAPPTAGPRVVAEGNALGIVAMGSLNTSLASIPISTSADATNALTVTTQVGRRYCIHFAMRAMSATAVVFAQAQLWMDGVNQYAAVGDRYQMVNATGFQQFDCRWEFDGDGAQHSYVVKIVAGAAAAVATYTTPGGHYYIEDVGPNTYPALPIPATPPAWTPLSGYQSTWVAYPGAGFGVPSYRKIGDEVMMRGLVQSGAITAGNSVMASLPAGFQPAVNQVLPVEVGVNPPGTAPTTMRLDVLSGNGNLRLFGAVAGGYDYVSLNSVRFSTTA
jgi:hypothetical protein